jgi:hypothetical protein
MIWEEVSWYHQKILVDLDLLDLIEVWHFADLILILGLERSML